MSKAFISILGTNDYLECRHSFNDIVTDTPVKYCQEDIIKIFCKDFDETSEIRFFLTEEAEKRNWLDNGHLDKDKNPIPNKGLKKRLEELNIKSKIVSIPIRDGFNEKEIWDIFQIIFESFKEEEEVIVDITHSFRSLPMLMITLLNFAKQVKRIKVLGIYYAAFESLGPISQVRNINVKQRIAPILNLTPFSDLQDWTNATYDFINNANTQKMSELINQSLKRREITNPIEKYFPLRVINKLSQLVENIALCRGLDLLKFDFDELRKNIKNLKGTDLPNSFNYLIDEILSKINTFSNNTTNLVIDLAEWCLKHNLYQQAITILQEFTITIIIQKCNMNISDETIRSITSQAFRIYSQNTAENDWKKPASENIEIVKELISFDLLKILSPVYSSLTELRNDVNHSGFLKEARTTQSIKNKLKNIIDSYKKILV